MTMLDASACKLRSPDRGLDLERRMEAHSLRDRFTRYGVAAAHGRRAEAAYLLARTDDERNAVSEAARDAAMWLNVEYERNAIFRDGDMAAWFAAEAMSLSELAALGADLRRSWREKEALKTEAERDAEDAADEAADAEDDRIANMEEAGRYGRTLRWTPDTDRYVYVRFGRMPEGGRSVFGLAAEDNEDGPDEWRLACGNMTTEAGVCVMRAHAHPAVPGGYVLAMPEFRLARYHVSDPDRYLNTVIPRFEDGEHPTVLRIDGCTKTIRAADGTLRCDLGSDGEYMIDVFRPYEIVPLSLDDMWVTHDVSVVEFLRQRRGYEAPSAPCV